MVLALGLIALWITTQFVVLPYLRMEQRRRQSRLHRPQAEEIWVQDDQLLYIDAVHPALGVEIMTLDDSGDTRKMNRWRDTWPEWDARLQKRVVWFTGERRPLGPA